LPELLGSNLATESFGVGDVYREAVDTNRTHGYDVTLSLIHNTIDNFSTGHTRQSVDAVVSAIERIARTHPEAVAGSWQRMCNSFVSCRAAFEPTWPPRRLQQAQSCYSRGEWVEAESLLQELTSVRVQGPNAMLQDCQAEASHLLGWIASKRSDHLA